MKRNLTALFICLFLTGGWIPTQAQHDRPPEFNAPPAPAFKPEIEALRTAQQLFVASDSQYLHTMDVVNELRKNADFKASGLGITDDDKQADLVMIIQRLKFSTHFSYVVMAPKIRRVVASGGVNSVFGTASGKIARNFSKQLKAARDLPAPKSLGAPTGRTRDQDYTPAAPSSN